MKPIDGTRRAVWVGVFLWMTGFLLACGDGVIFTDQEEQDNQIRPDAFCRVEPVPAIVNADYTVFGGNLSKSREILIQIRTLTNAEELFVTTNEAGQFSLEHRSSEKGQATIGLYLVIEDQVLFIASCDFFLAQAAQ